MVRNSHTGVVAGYNEPRGIYCALWNCPTTGACTLWGDVCLLLFVAAFGRLQGVTVQHKFYLGVHVRDINCCMGGLIVPALVPTSLLFWTSCLVVFLLEYLCIFATSPVKPFVKLPTSHTTVTSFNPKTCT